VAEYRVYKLGHDGRIFGYEPLVCADDAEAIKRAMAVLEANDLELWSGNRFVARLPGTGHK
jgi:hypothetical protein